MKIYNVYQSGKRLYIDEKENPDNKIVVNKYDNMQQTLRLVSDGTLPPRLYWALRNPKLSQKYFILKLVNNEDLIVGTDISATPGLWDMLLIGTDEDYIIEGADIDQSRLTYVSDHFGRLFVRDNFLEELDFEEQCSPTFKVFYDEIMFRLDNIPDLGDIPDKLSDLENDTNFISGVALKDDGEGHVEIIGTTFSGGETEEGEIPSGGSVEVDDKLDEESTNPVQNKVVAKEVNSLKQKDESLDKEVIALRERNAELEETVEKLQIKTTTTPSPFHHITDSANMKVLDFGMEGKTEQETTSGKNLFDISKFKSSNKFVNNGDGTITCMGYTPSLSTNKISECCPGIKAGQTIFISGNNIDNVYFGGVVKTVNIKNSQFTVTQEMLNDDRFGFYGDSDSTADNPKILSNIQIEITDGNTATEYEPFTNGASPNPEYPQPITNAGVLNEETGRYEIGCFVGNKNFFDVEKAKDESNYLRNEGIVQYYFFPVYIGAGNTFTFSWKLPTGNDLPNYTVLIMDAVGGNVINYVWYKGYEHWTKESYTLVSPNDYIYIRINENELPPWWEDFTDIQIEIGSVKTDYVPHASQQFTLTSPVPITKWDKLVKRDGVWGWSVWQLINTFNGSEEWYANNNNIDGYPVFRYDEISKGLIADKEVSICSHFRNKIGAWSNGVDGEFGDNRQGGDSIYFVTSVVEMGDVDGWKSWLQSNNIKVVTKASTEQSFHPLPEEEQTLLSNLETYYGVTNVYNEQGCPITLSYISHPQLYVDQKLEQINSALLSLGANV